MATESWQAVISTEPKAIKPSASWDKELQTRITCTEEERLTLGTTTTTMEELCLFLSSQLLIKLLPTRRCISGFITRNLGQTGLQERTEIGLALTHSWWKMDFIKTTNLGLNPTISLKRSPSGLKRGSLEFSASFSTLMTMLSALGRMKSIGLNRLIIESRKMVNLPFRVSEWDDPQITFRVIINEKLNLFLF